MKKGTQIKRPFFDISMPESLEESCRARAGKVKSATHPSGGLLASLKLESLPVQGKGPLVEAPSASWRNSPSATGVFNP